MAIVSSGLTIAGLLLLSASPFGAANARSPSSGITVTLRPESTVPPDEHGGIICLGAPCSRGTSLDLTVWKDGRTLEAGSPARVSAEHAARFSEILLPFRPTGKDATSDPSKLWPNSCPVKVQWPAGKGGRRPVVCGIYSGASDSLFPAVMRALQSIHLNIVAPGTPWP
jgi:hypothetical protein